MQTQDIRLVVFDMAGTVVDEKNVVYKTLQEALNKGGYPFSLEEVLHAAGGKEKFKAIKDLADSSTEEGQSPEQMYEDFISMLETAYQELEVDTYPGVREMVHRLRKQGVKIVLNTGYNTETASKLLKKMQWEAGREYDLLVAADQVENSRPAPDMIELAMKKLEINDPAQVAKVGDSVIDIEEGKSASCKITIGVTTGAHSKAQLQEAKPSMILDSLADLDAELATNNNVDTLS